MNFQIHIEKLHYKLVSFASTNLSLTSQVRNVHSNIIHSKYGPYRYRQTCLITLFNKCNSWSIQLALYVSVKQLAKNISPLLTPACTAKILSIPVPAPTSITVDPRRCLAFS